MERRLPRFITLILLGISPIIPSCGIQSEEIKPSITASSQTALSFKSAGGEATVNFTASHDWSVSSAQGNAADWLTVSPSSGAAGKGSIRIIAKENDTFFDRNATLRITSSTASLDIALSQGQKDALVLEDKTANVEAEGGLIVIGFGHNVVYSIETDVDWIKPADTRSFVEERLSFFVEENPSVVERTGTVTFLGKDEDGKELSAAFQVIQAGQIPFIAIAVSDLEVFSQGEVFAIETESNFDPSVSTDADWIVHLGNDPDDPHLYLFEARENTGGNDRSGTISFPSQYVDNPPTVVIRQKTTENGLGYGQLGVFSFGDTDWSFTAGEDQILMSNAGSALCFTLFNPKENVFFQIGGLLPFPEPGNVMDAKITQNLSPLVDALFHTTLSVERTDGPFVKLSSDRGFSLVVKTR